MSRSGYSEELDNWAMIKWRGVVASAIRGKRGQKLLRDLLAALDAMPEKALILEELVTEEGDVCALGALGKARGLDMEDIDPEDPEQIAHAFDIAAPLAQEIAYMNDEQFNTTWDGAAKRSVPMTPEQRWIEMRAWVASKINASALQS